jgi:hypothetical protein
MFIPGSDWMYFLYLISIFWLRKSQFVKEVFRFGKSKFTTRRIPATVAAAIQKSSLKRRGNE